MLLFVSTLIRRLDQETPGWKDDTVILLDNAAWHTSWVMQKRLARLGITVIYSGPYSYAAAPVDLAFAALKLGDLNPDRLPTGKK